MVAHPITHLIATASPPEAIALAQGDASLSYAALHERARAIAATLHRAGITAGQRVALALPDPGAQLAAWLGVAWLGAVAVPLPIGLAPARRAHLLADSGAALLLGDAPAEWGGPTLDPAALESSDAPDPAADPAALTLLWYQPGDGGQLEGIGLRHETLLNFATFARDTLKLDLTSLLCATPALDALALFAGIAALAQGGRVTFPAAPLSDAAALRHHVQAVAATALAAPLAPLVAWHDADPAIGAPRHVLTHGLDMVNAEALKATLKGGGTTFHHFYGLPTYQLVASPRPTDASGGGITLVGRPAAGVQALVLDGAQQLVGIGLPGELWVTGAGVAEVPADQQRPNPFAPGQTLTRTGVRARLQEQGRLELLERLDRRVALAGQTIALAEVERALLAHPAIQQAAVLARPLPDGSPALTAFLVAEEAPDPATIEAHLSAALAPQQVPVGLITLPRLPRTDAGTIEYEALRRVTALDSQQVATLQSTLRTVSGLSDLILLAQPQLDEPLPLALDELLPTEESALIEMAEEVPVEESARPVAIATGAPLRLRDEAPRTLAEALTWAAEHHPDHGVNFVDWANGDSRLSYPALLAEAERLLAGLQAAGIEAGQHVIFQFARNEAFVAAFWGCVLGGIVPVPLSVPPLYDPAHATVAKLHNAWQMLDHPPILTAEAQVEPIRRTFAAHDLAAPTLLPIERLRASEGSPTRPAVNPEDPALLLLTSGSTGLPKGVVQPHQNLIARSKGSAQFNGFTSEDISFNWMPLDHVGGIVMFHVHDLCLGAEQIQAPTDQILEEPTRWLDVIERFRATITWAPNFAFGLINAQAEQVNARRRDLASMRHILNGGEAVNAATAQGFLKLLAPHGLADSAICPAYGMSETSSGITSSHHLRAEGRGGIHLLDQRSLQGIVRPAEPGAATVSFVEVGAPFPDISLRIVDRHDQPLREGMIGRLQVKGATITPGYYRNEELNAEVFTADGWFTTGDLAFLDQGRLTITGREKDVIIINGLNYHSHEIEAVAETVPGVEVSFTAAVAVRRPQNDTDEVVLFFCSQSEEWEEQLAQADAIQQRLIDKMGLALAYVLPVSQADIPKTAIGKIQRTQLAKQFAAGHFATLKRRIDRARANEHTIPAWFFEPDWRPQPLPAEGSLPSGPIALVGAESPLLAALRDALRAADRPVLHLAPGAAFTRHDAHHYSLRPHAREDVEALLHALEKEGLRPRHWLYLLGYGPLATSPLSQAALHASQQQLLYPLLTLIQGLAEIAAPAQLTVVTSRSQMVEPGEAVAVEKSTLLGFLRTLRLEVDWLTSRHIDLPHEAADADRLLRELRAAAPEAEVAYRGEQRLVPGLRRSQFDGEAARDPFQPGGLYLITGGLGGIGSEVAKWLAERYQARLLLVGSTPLPAPDEETPTPRAAKRQRAAARLQAAGVPFRYEALDLSDAAQLRAAIKAAEAAWDQPLAGVLHLAGEGNLAYHWTVMNRHWLVSEQPATFETMFAPKVYGTLGLMEAIADRPDLLVIAFSSINSFFGGATFSAYSAANSFLDQAMLARAHAGQGKSRVLNWSGWDDVGMSADNPAHMRAVTRSRGYATIGLRQGLASLLTGAAHPKPQLFVGLQGSHPLIQSQLDEPFRYEATLNLYTTAPVGSLAEERISEQVAQHYRRQPMRFHYLPAFPLDETGAVDLAQLAEVGAAQAQAASPPAPPTNESEQALLTIWQEVLGREGIGIHDNFFTLGGHSLLASQVVARVRSHFQAEIRLHQLFETPTVAGLAAAIAAQPAPADDELASLFAELDGLSEEELKGLLNE